MLWPGSNSFIEKKCTRYRDFFLISGLPEKKPLRLSSSTQIPKFFIGIWKLHSALTKPRPAFTDCIALPQWTCLVNIGAAADFWEVTQTLRFGLGASGRVRREKHQALEGWKGQNLVRQVERAGVWAHMHLRGRLLKLGYAEKKSGTLWVRAPMLQTSHCFVIFT